LTTEVGIVPRPDRRMEIGHRSVHAGSREPFEREGQSLGLWMESVGAEHAFEYQGSLW
jgi:hypothetical protein